MSLFLATVAYVATVICNAQISNNTDLLYEWSMDVVSKRTWWGWKYHELRVTNDLGWHHDVAKNDIFSYLYTYRQKSFWLGGKYVYQAKKLSDGSWELETRMFILINEGSMKFMEYDYRNYPLESLETQFNLCQVQLKTKKKNDDYYFNCLGDGKYLDPMEAASYSTALLQSGSKPEEIEPITTLGWVIVILFALIVCSTCCVCVVYCRKNKKTQAAIEDYQTLADDEEEENLVL